MTQEEYRAFRDETERMTREMASLAVQTPRTPEFAFKRRVDAVWGNIATEEPNVKREDVERKLREYDCAEKN